MEVVTEVGYINKLDIAQVLIKIKLGERASGAVPLVMPASHIRVPDFEFQLSWVQYPAEAILGMQQVMFQIFDLD